MYTLRTELESLDQDIKRKYANFLLKMKENRTLVIMITIVVSIFWAKHAFTTNIGIDTEQYILEQYGKDWVVNGLGRPFLYYITMFLSFGKYNPYAYGCVFLTIFILAILSWIYVFSMLGMRSNLSYFIFAIICMTNPIWVAQFYFKLQEGAISAAFLMQAIAYALLFDSLLCEANSKICNTFEFIISVLCSFIAIGSYQSFAGLHLAEGAACLLLLFEKMMNEKDANLLKQREQFWIKGVIVVAQFFASYILYIIVCRFFNWGTSSYLQIRWHIDAISSIIANLAADFLTIVAGKGIYAGWIIPFGIACLVIFVIEYFFANVNIGIKFDYLLCCSGCIFAMFALNVVIGSVPEDRARLPIIFMAAFLGMYIFNKVNKKRKGHRFAIVAVIIAIASSILNQCWKSEILFYTDDICNQQEFQVGANIVNNIEKLGGGEQAKIIIVGKWEAPLNKSCTKQGPIGSSSFQWDYVSEDITSGTRRSVLYLNAAFGKEYIYNNEAERNVAIEVAKSMPAYPSKGYVEKQGEIYIVKLSDN